MYVYFFFRYLAYFFTFDFLYILSNYLSKTQLECTVFENNIFQSLPFATADIYFEYFLSNGHSPANLLNSSTRQNGHFGKLSGLDTFADIRQPVLVGLDTFVDIRQPSFLGLARLVKAKFCK